MLKEADILVIGGGIAGVSVAARLAVEARVIVLEREGAIGTHATGRSAATFIRNYGNATLRALNVASEPDFEGGTIADTPILTPRGELMIAGESDEALVRDYLAGGDGLARLTPREARELCPLLREDAFAVAVHEPDARDIDVDALLQGFRRILRAGGGEIETGAEVVSLQRKDGKWRVATRAGEVAAPIVVNAAGAWADRVAALASVRSVGLRPLRRSAAILPAPDGIECRDWPLTGALDESWYCKPSGGKLLVSPGDEDPVEPQDAWVDDMVLAEGLDRFERATTYDVIRVERSWAGLRSFTVDRTPVAGFAPDTEGFFWLAGQGGYGIQTAPALSRLAADLILRREPVLAPDVVAALSPSRKALIG